MPTTEHYRRLAKEGGKHAALFEDMANWSAEQECGSPLTENEKTVAKLIREGCVRSDIAQKMGVSQVMVSRHVSSMRERLRKPNTTDAQLVILLAEKGWLP